MTICRVGTVRDYPYIDSLRKKEGSALGFIPENAYLSVLARIRLSERDRFKTQQIYVTEDNGDLTGFCYASFADRIAKIFQIVVQQDARRWHRALLMSDAVESLARQMRKRGVTCRVAFDLESNFFWRGIGYEPIEKVSSTWLNQKESLSKRPLWVYLKDFQPEKGDILTLRKSRISGLRLS